MTKITDFASLGKVELRAACKLAGITGYSKMDVATMRAALTAYATANFETMDESGAGGHCPHCAIHLSNGVATAEDQRQGSPEQAASVKDMKNEVFCLGCGEEWGPKVDHTAAADRHTGTGLKIEKDRPERNGIKRPSIGGKCRAIWDHLDSMEAPTAKAVRAAAAELGWNPNNAVIEFYQWRKYNAA